MNNQNNNMEINNALESNRLRNLITQGHTVLPIALIGVMLFSDVFERPDEISTLFTEFRSEIWMGALFVITSLFLQMLVKTFDNKIFRWGVFAITAFFTAFVLLHTGDHIKEYLSGGINMHLPFDIVFYTVGIWTTVLSWKWARLKLDDTFAKKKERYSIKKIFSMKNILTFVFTVSLLHVLLFGGALGAVIGSVFGKIIMGAVVGTAVGAIIVFSVRKIRIKRNSNKSE